MGEPRIEGCRVIVEGDISGSTNPPTWDWGDGSISEGWFPQEHQYNAQGWYTIRAWVTTPWGERIEASKGVQIVNCGGPTQREVVWESEAEWGQIRPPMEVADDPSASGGQFVHTPPDKYEGEVTFSFSVPRDGNYVVAGRVWGLGWGNDSFWVSVDGGPEANWGIPHDTWKWDEVTHWNGTTAEKVIYYLKAGAHWLRIRTREHGSRLDVVQVIFVP